NTTTRPWWNGSSDQVREELVPGQRGRVGRRQRRQHPARAEQVLDRVATQERAKSVLTGSGDRIPRGDMRAPADLPWLPIALSFARASFPAASLRRVLPGRAATGPYAVQRRRITRIAASTPASSARVRITRIRALRLSFEVALKVARDAAA